MPTRDRTMFNNDLFGTLWEIKVFRFRGEYGFILVAVNSDSKGKLVVFVSKMGTDTATPSNCGNILKMLLPSLDWKVLDGQGNDLGYGKNVAYEYPSLWGGMRNGQSAAKSYVFSHEDMDAVHRLDVGGREWRISDLRLCMSEDLRVVSLEITALA